MRVEQARQYIDEVGIDKACKKLQAKRESVGLSQLALAKLSGIQQSNINRIESGKQAITPRTLARLMTAIERVSTRLSKEIETLRGIREARTRVAMCERLPWMKQYLPEARAQLTKLEVETRGGQDSLNDPIVRGILESYEREIKTVEELMSVREDILGKIAGLSMVRFGQAVRAGDPEAIEQVKRFEATGEAPKLVLDKVEKVESIEE
jgi:transcriptional regulator with XRE-family HTH domain